MLMHRVRLAAGGLAARNGLCLALVLAGGWLAGACADTRSVSDAQYWVTGTACAADIQSTDAHGRTEQRVEQVVPWSSAFTYDPDELSGVVLALGVTNRCAWGDISAQIYLDGVSKSRQTCSTAFCTVTVTVQL
ncbi:MAG: hypothetical protein HY342_10405 [Candidatus Lambdaproteobacteria bacterium]|nr:hypothetical protein [Candidatus Lambdaproteobacteria bacterium]